MKRRTFLHAAARGALAGVVGTRAAFAVPRRAAPDARLVERWSWAMGQPVRVLLFAVSEDEGYDAAAAALAELRRVEARLSLFDEESDLVELNRQAGRGAVRVGEDLATVLSASLRLAHVTHGAFDVAVEPLMRAWGFHARRATAPSAAELAEACAAVHAAGIALSGNVVTVRAAHTAIDLGGIGVGYGLDRAGVVLRARGVTRAFLDVSGDCLAIGAPPGQVGWPVEIAHPDGGERRLGRVLLCDAALATSANTQSTVRWNGRTIGHVLDPATGEPARGCRQATAVCASAVDADALSTAMLVSGVRYPDVRRAVLG